MDLSYSSWITYWSGTSGNNRGLFSTALSHIFSYANQEQFSLTKYLLLQLFHTCLGLYSNQEHTTETMGIFSLPRCIFLGSFIKSIRALLSHHLLIFIDTLQPPTSIYIQKTKTESFPNSLLYFAALFRSLFRIPISYVILTICAGL